MLLVGWGQPLIEQLANGSNGNMARMVSAVGNVGEPLGARLGTQVAAATLSLPAWWSRSEFAGIRVFSPRPPIGWAAGSLVLVIIVAVVACRWTWRRGWSTEAAALLTVCVSVPIAWIASTQTPTSAFFGINPDFSRWLWPTSVFVWFAGALTLWRLVVPRARSVVSERALLVSSVVVVVLAASANLPSHHSSVGAADRSDNRAVAVPLIDEAAANLDVDQVRYTPPTGYDVYGPPLLARLQHDGIDFFVDDDVLVRQFGQGRRLGDRSVPEIRVLTGIDAVAAAGGASTVARVSALNDEESRELLELVSTLERRLADGEVSLTDAGRETVAVGLAPAWFSELEAGVVDATTMIRSASLAEAIDSGAITGDPATAAELQRFMELDSLARDSTAAVVLLR